MLGVAIYLRRPIVVIHRSSDKFLDPIRVYGDRTLGSDTLRTSVARPGDPVTVPVYFTLSFDELIGALRTHGRSPLSIVEWNGANHFDPWVKLEDSPATIHHGHAEAKKLSTCEDETETATHGSPSSATGTELQDQGDEGEEEHGGEDKIVSGEATTNEAAGKQHDEASERRPPSGRIKKRRNLEAISPQTSRPPKPTVGDASA